MTKKHDPKATAAAILVLGNKPGVYVTVEEMT